MREKIAMFPLARAQGQRTRPPQIQTPTISSSLFRADHLNKPDDNTGGLIVTANKIVFEDDAGVDCKITNVGGLPIVDIFDGTQSLYHVDTICDGFCIGFF
jgi:hypothetical protein